MGTAWKVTGSPLTRQSFYAAPAAQPPAADIETLRRFFAEEYYKFIYTTVKALDPNHLYMGFWIVFNWWENEEDWRIMTRYVDVIGFDRYAFTYDNAQVQRLFGEADKPAILGEFSFPQHYSSARGFGSTTGSATDEAHAAALYEKWTEAAARDPYLIGQMWFQYRDQHITGRDDTAKNQLVLGESLAFGLVDIADRPKWPLVTAIRRANLKAAAQRLEARDVLQAESAAKFGAVTASALGGYTGTGYVDFVGASGDYVEWTVNAPTAGTYRLVFRYSNGGGADRPLELRVDNVAVSTLPFPQTAAWTTWTTQSHTLTLGAGTHKVRLTATGASGGNIDYLQLTHTGTP
ncbi:carbohydrate-binding protein [Cystobacter fuscus]